MQATDSIPIHGGFTVLEAMVASALLAFGLAGAMRLSMITLAATQISRHVDVASGLAQDLAECWGLQTPSCQSMFQTGDTHYPIDTDPHLGFVRTWQVRNVPVAGMPAMHLQELQIAVSWLEGPLPQRIDWQHRRASTPMWVGR